MTVFLEPAVAVAGGELLAKVVLVSKSETPVDSISLTLTGDEWIGGGKSWDRRTIVGQRAAFGERTLEKGEQRVSAKFVIPPDAPPTHAGRSVHVAYELDVHVSIPWWPDRRERYVVPVTRRALEAPSAPPKVFTNRKSGPADLHLEATVDSVTIEQGGAIAGAVSFANVAGKRIKSVDLVFQAREGIFWNGQQYWTEGATYVSNILERAPRDEESAQFRVRFPDTATASFGTRRAQLAWSVAIVARVSFGDDVTVEIPITVVPANRKGAAQARRRTVLPPVGRERRALLFRAVGERLGLELDAEAEELRGDVGAASLVIRLDQREDEGLFAIAELGWPGLGMELSVRERKWTDAFGEMVDLGDERFQKRVHVLANDAERTRRMFDDELRAALLGLALVELEDDGAILGRPVSVLSTESMLADVLPLHAAAESLGAAVARVAATATAYR